MTTEEILAAAGFPGEHGWIPLLPVAASINLLGKGSPGSYLMLKDRCIVYAGRADKCLRNRLRNHNHLAKCDLIFYRYEPTKMAAYKTELVWVDRLKKNSSWNKIRPAFPHYKGRQC